MKPNRLLRVAALVLFLFLSSVSLLAQGELTPEQKELADYIQKNYTKREERIPMRDGVKLFTSIYEPKNAKQKYPILLGRTPYTVSPYGADKYKTLIGPSELFAREGYIFVYQDVRGRFMSEGEYVDIRPYIPNKTGNQTDETTDTYDTVEWLIKSVANNNGRRRLRHLVSGLLRLHGRN